MGSDEIEKVAQLQFSESRKKDRAERLGNDMGGYASLEFFDTLWKMTAIMSAIFTSS